MKFQETLKQVHRHINDHFEEHLKQVQEYVRQPSISAQTELECMKRQK